MFLRALNIIFVFAFLISMGLPSYSMSADDYCEIHNNSGAPGECEASGECAVLYTNLGTEECKSCGDGGCELVDCSECE